MLKNNYICLINKYLSVMNNFVENYEIILKHLKETCGDIKSFYQIRTPKLSNLELAAMNFGTLNMSINTALHLFRCLKGTYLEPIIERSNYNKRRRKIV